MGEKFQLSVDVPGVKENDIDVKIQDGNLTVKGERIVKSESSQSKSSFSQIFSLDDKVDVENLSATLTNGVLTIAAPKFTQQAIEETARKIPVIAMNSNDDTLNSKDAAKEGAEVDRKTTNATTNAMDNGSEENKPNEDDSMEVQVNSAGTVEVSVDKA